MIILNFFFFEGDFKLYLHCKINTQNKNCLEFLMFKQSEQYFRVLMMLIC
jgi:hypothetical protein